MLPEPFWQKLVMAAIGPVLTAMLGGLAVHLVIESLEDQRKNQGMKLELIREMSTVANGLYFSLQDYSRRTEEGSLSADSRNLLRDKLDDQYRSSLAAAAAIETRLKLLFARDDARRFWHAARDILQVRYFELLGLATDKLLADNARDGPSGEWHSGLTRAELKSFEPEKLMKEYHDRLDKAIESVLSQAVVRISPEIATPDDTSLLKRE